MFSAVSESQMRWWRWLLLLGWLVLIASLLVPGLTLPAALTPACDPDALAAGCGLHRQPGNRLFWGVVVPTGVLMIGVVSHELWRRICPLAFVSQLARALGWQRTRSGKGGRLEVVKVEASSWLGRHHIALQWSLLIAGLCLRLLWVNSSPVGLALLLLVTLLAAVLVGWAYGGKAWCQYVCPMGPVQTVLTGLRGPLGSTAHWGASSRVTQSMCRTIATDGREQSACVACQTPCLDIDAERAFWQTSRGKRALSWAWLSYPGLVLAFFGLMEATVEGSDLLPDPLGYLRSGAWAFDAELGQRVWLPLQGAPAVPRLIWIPLLLSAAGALSVLVFEALQAGLQRRYRSRGASEPADRALLHTRLLATFVAINSFFWFVDPLQGALGSHGGQLLRSLVLCLSAIALFRSWSRDQATYRRESVSDSLRRQLHDMPGLESALDGRLLEALSPQEVFTLVKAMPAVGRQQARSVYKGVMSEMLRSGRLDRAAALLELADLRQTLVLEEADHHAVVSLLSEEQPQLLDRDRLQRQRDELRLEAAAEGLAEVLRLAGCDVLNRDRLRPELLARLDRLQQESGLDPQTWEQLEQRFGPRGERELTYLTQQRQAWAQQAALQLVLQRRRAAQQLDPMLNPLLRVLEQRLETWCEALEPRLQASGAQAMPAPAELQALAEGIADPVASLLTLLGSDPDPDTVSWVRMLLPEHGTGQPVPLLQQQHWQALTSCALLTDLAPADLLWVAGQGVMRSHEPAAVLMQRGEPSTWLAVVLRGSVVVQTTSVAEVVLGQGQAIGEMGVITTSPRSATVVAGPDGVELFALKALAFEELLQRSRGFSRGLLEQLAERLTTGSARAGSS